MKAGTTPERARSLVIELAARTAIVDGKRVELPPTEFSLLAVLAARPGEVVSHKELLAEAFGDSAYMDTADLHWRIWNIRKLLGDHDRRLVRNRRGQGFVLELRPRAVKIIEGVATEAELETTEVIRLDDSAEESLDTAEDEATETPGGAGAPVVAEDEPVESAPLTTRARVRPVTVLVALLLTGLAFGGSWVAGYALSQRAAPAGQDAREGEPGGADSSESDDAQDRRKASTTDDGDSGARQGGRPADDTSGIVAGDGGSSSEVRSARTSDGKATSSGAGNTDQKPPSPQPDAHLYHLFNPDDAEHFMTTSSSIANQKQAAGYDLTVEGRVFTKQVKGTVAITVDDGTAYVYRSRAAAPKGVSVTELYHLSNNGDFFFTKSSSDANQAEAQGWSRSVAGFVQ